MLKAIGRRTLLGPGADDDKETVSHSGSDIMDSRVDGSRVERRRKVAVRSMLGGGGRRGGMLIEAVCYFEEKN